MGHGAYGTYMEPMGHDSSTVFGTPLLFFFRSHWLIELFEEDESYGKIGMTYWGSKLFTPHIYLLSQWLTF